MTMQPDGLKYRWQQSFNGSEWHDTSSLAVKPEIDALLAEYNGIEIEVNVGNGRNIKFRKVLDI